MKRFFAFAVIVLMCLPAFVSCKKDKTSSTNFLKIDGEEQKIVSAEFLDEPDEYFLIIHTEGNLGFDFELSKANKGEKIDLLKPDPLAPMPKAAISDLSEIIYYSIVAYDTDTPLLTHEIASGDPKTHLPALGEGSYMKIDEKNGRIVLDFELRNCRFDTPFQADDITISGHYDDFKKYIAPPK